MKKLTVVLALFVCAPQLLLAAVIPAPPQLAAKAYILMDSGSGQIIAQADPDMPVEPASLTKIMTVFVAAQELAEGRLTLDEQALISEKAYRTGGSKMFVEVDARVPVRDLLKGIIVQSGNDASVALAEHLAGTEAVFASMMNQAAVELGMRNTRFQNATGLPHPEHITTARDMALLTRALVQRYPDVYAWFSEKEFTWSDIRQSNRNRLLFLDPTVDGVKTGHTEAAGYCLVASAEREGVRLISVVVGANSVEARTDDSRALLEYGFRFFDGREVYAAKQPVVNYPVFKGKARQVALGFSTAIALTYPRGRYADINLDVDVELPLVAPIVDGQQLGTGRFVLEGETLHEAPLVAVQPVPRAGIVRRVIDSVRLLLP